MGDRQKIDHGILKEGFMGKAKLNKVSQLFSKKGKVRYIDACLLPLSLWDGIVRRSLARAAVKPPRIGPEKTRLLSPWPLAGS